LRCWHHRRLCPGQVRLRNGRRAHVGCRPSTARHHKQREQRRRGLRNKSVPERFHVPSAQHIAPDAAACFVSASSYDTSCTVNSFPSGNGRNSGKAVRSR
jgi:hypothetical protein